MAEVADRLRRGTLWTAKKLSCIKWHQWGRLVAILTLVDQFAGPLGSIPSSEAIVVVALGALFAPVPSHTKKDDS